MGKIIVSPAGVPNQNIQPPPLPAPPPAQSNWLIGRIFDRSLDYGADCIGELVGRISACYEKITDPNYIDTWTRVCKTKEAISELGDAYPRAFWVMKDVLTSILTSLVSQWFKKDPATRKTLMKRIIPLVAVSILTLGIREGLKILYDFCEQRGYCVPINDFREAFAQRIPGGQYVLNLARDTAISVVANQIIRKIM